MAFAIIVDGVLKLLVRRISIAALLKTAASSSAYLVIEIGWPCEAVRWLIPLLSSWGLCAVSGKLVCFFSRLWWLAHRITAQHKAPQSRDENKEKIFFIISFGR